MRKIVSLAIILVFSALICVFAGMENTLLSTPLGQPFYKNNNLFMKNQFITSYAACGKYSYFQNSWLGAFSYRVSPLTTMTFSLSVNKLDGNIPGIYCSQAFPLYSVQVDYKKKSYSYGLRFGNEGTTSYLIGGDSLLYSDKVPQRVDGYIEKTFMEGTLSLSLYGSTTLSR